MKKKEKQSPKKPVKKKTTNNDVVTFPGEGTNVSVDKRMKGYIPVIADGFKRLAEKELIIDIHLTICSKDNPDLICLHDLPLWEQESASKILTNMGRKISNEYKDKDVDGFALTFQAMISGPFSNDAKEEEIENKEKMDVLVTIGKSMNGTYFVSVDPYVQKDNKLTWLSDVGLDDFKNSIIESDSNDDKGIHFSLMEALWTSYKFNNIVTNI